MFLEQPNVHVNGKSVLGTVQIKNGYKCVLGIVLRLDMLLDHYLVGV